MASQKSELGPLSAGPAPKLKMPADTGQAREPYLVLQHDPVTDKYDLCKPSNDAARSVISLTRWVRVSTGSIPPELLAAGSTALPEEGAVSAVKPRPVRNSFARISAWVKRSGRGLVVRLLRPSNQSQQDLIDIHFLDGNPIPDDVKASTVTELGGSPVLELPEQVTELSASAICSSEELPGSETSSELPTIHGSAPPSPQDLIQAQIGPSLYLGPFDTSDAPAGPTDGLDDQAASSSWSRGDEQLNTPATTITTFSNADTLVDDNVSHTTEQPPQVSQPIVRGLTISRSVRYRCASQSHQRFEPASPVEVLQLVTEAAKRKTDSIAASGGHQREANLKPREASQESPGHDTKLVASASTAAKREDVHTSALNRLRAKAEDLVVPQEPPARAHILFTAHRRLYEQDLHTSRTSHESISYISELHSGHGGLGAYQQVANLLSKFHSQHGADRRQNVHLGDQEALEELSQLPSQRLSATSPGRLKLRSLGVAPHPEDIANKKPKPKPGDQKVAPSMPLDRKIEPPDERRSVDEQPGCSPISPLTKEQLQRRGSAISHFLPNPMTPARSMSQLLANSVADAQDTTDVERSPAKASRMNGQLDSDKEQAHAPSNAENNTVVVGNTEPHGSEPEATAGSSDLSPEFNEAKYLTDFSEHQQSVGPGDKFPAFYKLTRFKELHKLDTNVADFPPPQVVTEESAHSRESVLSPIGLTGRAEPRRRGFFHESASSLISGCAEVVMRSTLWLQRHFGQEPPVPEGHVRIRWECTCGERLYDDLVELRPGAAIQLEAVLNRQKPHPHATPGSGSRSSRSSYQPTPNGSRNTSASSANSRSAGMWPSSGYPYNGTSHPVIARANSSFGQPFQPPLYLLACINEARNTPKVRTIPLHQNPSMNDCDLANALRAEYAKANESWWRSFHLRGLTSIQFVRFYMHRNKFADVSKCPDVPDDTYRKDYEFDSSDTIPPVGPQYLLHLFKHPHQYEEELVAYYNIPKRLERLQDGLGWGISLTEGFLPERIWLLIGSSMVLFSIVFAFVWWGVQHDIQGAFAVASFFTSLAGAAVGFTQACLG
jgi:hypothetical protein